MAKKKDLKRRGEAPAPEHRIHPDVKRSIWAIALLGFAILLIFAGFHKAGPAGEFIFNMLETLLGWGYFVLPISLIALAGVFLLSERKPVISIALLGAGLAVLSALGLIDLFANGKGGWLGLVLGSLRYPFGQPVAVALNIVLFAIAALVTLNSPLKFDWFTREKPEAEEEEEEEAEAEKPAPKKAEPKPEPEEEEKPEAESKPFISLPIFRKSAQSSAQPKFKDYVAPPLDLLKSSSEKPTTGDLRANANIIKRTLESFGIIVEMGEINVGPKVTRYTLKPAEGVKLSRITALGQDLALALAAHPIRIEAPIPGKSLVGIEVPNKAAALVRLGNLMAYSEFQSAGPLAFALGRDVMGEPIFANIEKMPHLLIAGATGSGKSVSIHSLIVSLLYKNSPSSLRMIMIDPKRVELSMYEGIPHLISPVITEAKKSVAVFRWAISEMERRYELLQHAGSRDIKSYNANARQQGGQGSKGESLPADRQALPYIVMVVDELADLMTSYGREVEGSIVRLAQMARATGIHLVLSTQRPSVEVITGLIKANITTRIALQVASQIDSRTILDTAGAEKLLGGGDLLFVTSDFSKPRRLQGGYLAEEEINKVADFIRENNAAIIETEKPSFGKGQQDSSGEPLERDLGAGAGVGGDIFDEFGGGDGDDDELYTQAVEVVGQAKKASASLLQRRLKVGYARAARLLDLMEERGVIGPGEGAKPREVYLENIQDNA